MPRIYESQCIIENLPEVHRKKVLDAIISGASLRKIAALAGCSTTAVMAYKKRVVKPALQTAHKVQEFQTLATTDVERIREHAALTRDIVTSSPLRQRLEYLWDKSQKALERAENSVRVVKDQDSGELMAVGPDVAAIAPIMNQAHKNCELLGRVTGELETAAPTNIAIQVVLPSGPPDAQPGPTIDITPTIDIGTIQR